MEYKNYVGIVTYVTIFVFYIFSLKASTEIGKAPANAVHLPKEIKILGQYRFHFFTVWNFMLQILFLLTAVLDETSKLLDLPVLTRKRLGRTRAFLFNTLVFPCSLLVVTIFWTIWHIDRELVLPKILDKVFPLWLNHVMHTIILVPLAVELALPKRYNFVRFENAAATLVLYALFYQLQYFSIYLRHGIWLYGIYATLTWTQRFLFSVFQLLLLLLFLKIGITIQDSKRIQQPRKIA
ncbi:androgen-dependent TFPI-regulating protein-like [Anoplophora glabripennis]|uniref:androgen-dependent TFPI-regulating protein-like n=1 Tax=Anoplophora glabripennis TaxID=217634 RepID=UPI00087449D2|nr:androgen-dependent TFPI-regulating protein-like [Anoplophora glabripennis]